jgi:hypothetical protein
MRASRRRIWGADVESFRARGMKLGTHTSLLGRFNSQRVLVRRGTREQPNLLPLCGWKLGGNRDSTQPDL